MIRTLAALALVAGLGLAARADILPPPSQMTTYTVQLGPDLSQLLLASVPFQTSAPLAQATKNGCKASLTQKVFKTGDSTIACTEPAYCMGHIPASCTVTFKGVKGQNAASLVTSVAEKK